jgi:hypothetical protein
MKLRRGAEQFDKVGPDLEQNSSVKGIKRLLDVLMIQWFKVTKEVIGFYGQSCDDCVRKSRWGSLGCVDNCSKRG